MELYPPTSKARKDRFYKTTRNNVRKGKRAERRKKQGGRRGRKKLKKKRKGRGYLAAG